MPTLEGPNAGGLPSLEGPNAGGKVKMLEVYIIGGGTRGAGGATAPPDFKIYVFGPPQISTPELTNIGWKSLLSMYYCFSSVTFRRVFW